MKYAFFGSTEFSKNVLDKLSASGLKPVAVITNQPKLQGRHQILTQTPVDLWAQKNNITVLTPKKLDKQFISLFKKMNLDLAILVAYGKIIPQEILNIPKLGFINLHPSLLPKMRGPSPIQSSILEGDKETGVTIMLLDEFMDHGPILTQVKTDATNQSYPHLSTKLSDLGSELLINTIPLYLKGQIKPSLQNESLATYCQKIKTIDGLIDWSKDNVSIIRQILAFNPQPGTYTVIKHKNKDTILKILSAQITTENPKLKPGQFFITKNNELAVKCQSGAIILDTVQISGKKPVTGMEFLRGHREIISL